MRRTLESLAGKVYQWISMVYHSSIFLCPLNILNEIELRKGFV